MTHYPTSQVTHKIRCCDLRKGDTFEMTGVHYKVVDIDTSKIHFRCISDLNYGNRLEMGSNSQRWVLLIKRGNIIL